MQLLNPRGPVPRSSPSFQGPFLPNVLRLDTNNDRPLSRVWNLSVLNARDISKNGICSLVLLSIVPPFSNKTGPYYTKFRHPFPLFCSLPAQDAEGCPFTYFTKRPNSTKFGIPIQTVIHHPRWA